MWAACWDSSLRETDKLAKLVPNAPNNSLTVGEAVEKIPELRALYESETAYAQLLDYAQVLEGLSRHASVHAAGVVIAPGPLARVRAGMHAADARLGRRRRRATTRTFWSRSGT